MYIGVFLLFQIFEWKIILTKDLPPISVWSSLTKNIENEFFYKQALIFVYYEYKNITGGWRSWEIDLKRNDSESSVGM